jgi:hypothetical protein
MHGQQNRQQQQKKGKILVSVHGWNFGRVIG